MTRGRSPGHSPDQQGGPGGASPRGPTRVEVIIVVAGLTALAACGTQAAVPTRPAEPPSGLAALIDVMAQRLLIADTVAAAKWAGRSST